MTALAGMRIGAMKQADRLYLDHNASVPLTDAARRAMLDVMALGGNASSTHAEGRAMRKHVEAARVELADHAGVAPKQVIFTSGATEAAAMVLSPIMRKSGGELRCARLLVSAIEHPCVLAGGRFAPEAVATIPVTSDGVVDLDALEALLQADPAASGPSLVAIMLANNETGVIQPVREASDIVRRHGGLLMVDAVQGLGRLDIAPAALGADFVIVSAHKIGGPQGAGALILGDASLAPVAMLRGGGQENFHRAGTENVAAIAGFGAAIAELRDRADRWAGISAIRDFLEGGVDTISREAGMAEPVVFGSQAGRLANTLCFAQPGISAETALISLDLAGIAVSSGSACSSGKVRASHVLEAMGVSEALAGSALRISLGSDSTGENAGRFLAAWKDIVGRMARRVEAA